LFDYDSALIIFKTNTHIFLFLITLFPAKIHIYCYQLKLRDNLMRHAQLSVYVIRRVTIVANPVISHE